MSYKITVIPHTLIFKRPAGTSRGVYTDRKVWYLKMEDDKGNIGFGECAPLPHLSCDYPSVPEYEASLQKIIEQVATLDKLEDFHCYEYPSIDFAIHTAYQQMKVQSWALQDTSFSRGESSIPINGLVWMGTYQDMYQQIKEKLAAGFHCIKLKIGAIDFEEEYALLKYIRQHFSADTITLRVDANGAFAPQDAMHKLDRLSQLDIHSIEQPIKAGQWEEMRKLTEKTPIPIALDEELIGHYTHERMQALLDSIQPQYIILKPSLHSNCPYWIEEAEKRNIGWWATSALESNIGLNAIAQWVAQYDVRCAQGLGTGKLFESNVDVPIHLEGERMFFDCKENESCEISKTKLFV